jgi:hypothetical protein
MVRSIDLIFAIVEPNSELTPRIILKHNSIAIAWRLVLFVFKLVIIHISLVCWQEIYLLLKVARVPRVHLAVLNLSIW